MLNRLQSKYADKPVRFILVPCNQFGAQEPAPNAEIKSFAEKSVKLATSGSGSNVIMLAKSNLNNVACTYSGEDACTPASAECCGRNDAVYDYLLARTAPGTIQWNFDKIITDVSGKPFAGEVIMHGGDIDAQVSSIVDRLLAEAKTTAALLAAPASAAETNLAVPPAERASEGFGAVPAVMAMSLFGAFVAAKFAPCVRIAATDDDSSAAYIQIA
eukprot:gb/GFBE01017041.1/.p1 GENE.gb/GFBE01017041.1/~~gb/GFBE01017041.1/.p1  ORF type:complete len:216 (+),score=58.25 gb/GFBE01017041.1/:1-648(+)